MISMVDTVLEIGDGGVCRLVGRGPSGLTYLCSRDSVPIYCPAREILCRLSGCHTLDLVCCRILVVGFTF